MIPVVILALCAFALLKAANAWISFNSAGAQEVSLQETQDVVELSTESVSNVSASENSESFAQRRILEQLASRRAALDAREQELDTREKLLAAAEVRIEEQLMMLTEQREELAALSAERERVEQEDFSELSSAYARMKPRDAARIFNVLENDILVPVAAGMRTQALAGVLAEMEPEKARALTKELAARSKRHASIKPAKQ